MAFIKNIIQTEEDRFHETLNDGLLILETIMEQEKENNSDVISGKDVFRLYDTYGFPKELTEEYVEEAGFSIDEAGFEAEMNLQRERARQARQKVDSMQVQDDVYRELKAPSSFIGYEQSQLTTTVEAIIENDKLVDVQSDDEVYLVFAKTPFYAESGGQISDTGQMMNNLVSGEIIDVKKAPKGQHLHRVKINNGQVKVGDVVTVAIDQSKRQLIEKNHTATHLLHQALKDVLGEHVNQAGSLVKDDRLRFDFSHFSAVTDEELDQIEQHVNQKIWETIPVKTGLYPLEEAKKLGATALFGEKYGDVVRVVQINDYSLELCGGCHVNNTAEIGMFKLIGESGIGAGTRRIEALTGQYAYLYTKEQADELEQIATHLKTNPNQLIAKVENLLDEIKELKRENESLSMKIANEEATNILEKVENVNGVSVLAEQVVVKDMNQLRSMVDDLKQKLDSGIILLATVNDEKVQLAAGVSKDLIKEGYHAGKLIKEAANVCGGGGGGRPDMAQAGGKEPENIEKALLHAKKYISSLN